MDDKGETGRWPQAPISAPLSFFTWSIIYGQLGEGARRSPPLWGFSRPGEGPAAPPVQDQAHLDLGHAAGPGILGCNRGIQGIQGQRPRLWTRVNLNSGSESATERRGLPLSHLLCFSFPACKLGAATPASRGCDD